MIQHLSHRSRWLILFVGALVVVVALGWYAMEPVRPECTTFSGRYVPFRGLPDDEEAVGANSELDARAYQRAVESGHCEPPHARWHEWRD